MPVPSLRVLFASLFLILLSVAACTRQAEPPAGTILRKDAPILSARDINVIFSDSGLTEAQLSGPLMNRYGGEKPRLEFPEGFTVSMFDSAGAVITTITGKSGVRRESDYVMEARGEVVVRNIPKKEQLETEHLVWDERARKIWSDTQVRITRPGQILTGSGMESNETFSRYSIRNPEGEMAVPGDSL